MATRHRKSCHYNLQRPVVKPQQQREHRKGAPLPERRR